MKKVSSSDRLLQIMRERNLRQIDILHLAKPYCDKYNIKLGRNDLSQYVSGKVEPGQYKLFILAKALCVSEAWLMGYDVERVRVDERAVAEPEPLQVTDKYEKSLIENYRKLSDQGKEYILQTMNMAVKTYKKDSCATEIRK